MMKKKYENSKSKGPEICISSDSLSGDVMYTDDSHT